MSNSFSTQSLDSQVAKLELNARLFQYDKTLDDAANLFDADPIAWSKLPVLLQDRSGMYRDARAAYRRAVAAGAVADDRSGPTSADRNPS